MQPVVSAISRYTEAVSFSGETLQVLQQIMHAMIRQTEIERLASFIRMLGIISLPSDTHVVGQAVVEDSRNQRLQRVYMYVFNHYQQAIMLADVARLIGMDKSSFCIFFKKMTGKSFVTFLTEFRIESSCQMLGNTSLSIAEICFATGFRDVPYYNRVFKKQKGMTPSEFRQLKAEECCKTVKKR